LGVRIDDGVEKDTRDVHGHRTFVTISHTLGIGPYLGQEKAVVADFVHILSTISINLSWRNISIFSIKNFKFRTYNVSLCELNTREDSVSNGICHFSH